MKHRYLEVMFRKGKPLAAYLYLPRPSGTRVDRTVDAGHGVRVDLDETGKAIGVEVTAPSAVTATELNAILASHEIAALDADEWPSLAA
jgi:uncharacterized protein YuzE